MPSSAQSDPAKPSRVSGEDILAEVLRNMEDGLFKIRYTTLAPCIFRVYLHPGDYDPLRGAVPYLVDEIKRALSDRLEELKKSTQAPALLRRLGVAQENKMEYKILSGDWLIEFDPDAEGKLDPGDIEIYSELGAAPKMDYGAGSLTRRITKRQASGETSSQAQTTQQPETVYARIRFEDVSGPRTFAVTKNQVVIGRGGKAYWVDLKLDTVSDVSREHCRLRRDPASGQFHLKDMSQFGTTVNGKLIPSSVETVDGEQKDKNVESPLPAKARIGLADTLFLDFEALER